jgi:hypothetical protein
MIPCIKEPGCPVVQRRWHSACGITPGRDAVCVISPSRAPTLRLAALLSRIQSTTRMLEAQVGACTHACINRLCERKQHHTSPAGIQASCMSAPKRARQTVNLCRPRPPPTRSREGRPQHTYILHARNSPPPHPLTPLPSLEFFFSKRARKFTTSELSPTHPLQMSR